MVLNENGLASKGLKKSHQSNIFLPILKETTYKTLPT